MPVWAKRGIVENIVILTGAGLSAESGLGTFRGREGTWGKVDPAKLANPKAFARNPRGVHSFYNRRRAACVAAAPNAAHLALTELQRTYDGKVLIVTQNVDDLHQRAGSENVLQMHGALLRARCSTCQAKWPAALSMKVRDACPQCGAQTCRPDIVWFGESPYHMTEIRAAIAECHLFVVIGSSGTVYPAAGFAAIARENGSRTLAFNLEAPSGADVFDELIIGPATRTVPRWVDKVLQSQTWASGVASTKV